MKQSLTEALSGVLPNFTLLSSPLALSISATGSAIASKSVGFENAFKLLLIFFCVDFITGVLASYFEWRKRQDKKDRWFMGRGEGFNSDKARKCFIKLLIYMGTPYMFREFGNTFGIKTFKFESVSNLEIDLPVFVMLVFIAIEGFSIFHENLPKCGLNIFSSIKKIFNLYHDLKTKFNGEK